MPAESITPMVILDRRSDKLTSFLKERGLKKGDVIAFLAHNYVEFIDAFFVSCKAGIIVTSYNCNLEEIVRNGWVHTGDIAVTDEDGYYYIIARKKNMYISGG